MIDLEKECACAMKLALAAGKAVMAIYDTDLKVTSKADGKGPVTEADLLANRIILKGLQETFPQDGILSEEMPDSLERLKKERVWCIDPIDGTKDFIAKNGEFAIQIGLIINGKAMLGVLYLPAKDALYFGGPHMGATLLSGLERTKLHVNVDKPMQDLIIANSRFHRNESITVFMEKTGIHKEITHGSIGGKVSIITKGEADLFLYAAPHVSEWDICAPQAILEGAGGKVTDCMGGPLHYNQEIPNYPKGIIGISSGNYPELYKVAQGLIE